MPAVSAIHLERVRQARKAIQTLFSDTSVSQEQTVESLVELQSEIGSLADSVRADLARPAEPVEQVTHTFSLGLRTPTPEPVEVAGDTVTQGNTRVEAMRAIDPEAEIPVEPAGE